jgi:predicted small lipoprotein YifL
MHAGTVRRSIRRMALSVRHSFRRSFRQLRLAAALSAGLAAAGCGGGLYFGFDDDELDPVVDLAASAPVHPAAPRCGWWPPQPTSRASTG